MTQAEAIKKRVAALRDSQLALYHSLQQAFNDISGEMLGNKEWRTDIVDGSLSELLDEINDHFGNTMEDSE